VLRTTGDLFVNHWLNDLFPFFMRGSPVLNPRLDRGGDLSQAVNRSVIVLGILYIQYRWKQH
jgi:hypothetical protein